MTRQTETVAASQICTQPSEGGVPPLVGVALAVVLGSALWAVIIALVI